MTFGSLFAGIGGFDLGLERAGMTCAWQVEIDPYARRVLEKHWPHVRRWDDVRTFPPPDGEWEIDLICGGFPCQPVSFAGKRRGSEDERWLWPEFARVLRELRPCFAILENTPGLLTAGFDAVLGDLASLGYDAEWSVLSACTLGAPHTRERVFVIAYANSLGWLAGPYRSAAATREGPQDQPERRHWWATEPGVQRVAHGVPSRVDRLRCLGNAVVPQVAEWIGRCLIDSLALEKTT